MIPTTLGALAAAEPALARLSTERLPYAAAYRLAKLTTAVAAEVRHFHDQRNALVRELGAARNGNPDDVVVLPTMPSWPTFVARVEELAAVPVRLAVEPLELARAPGLTIAAADLLQLGPLVTDEGTPP